MKAFAAINRRGLVFALLAACTPQQRPWQVPVADGAELVAPSDRGLRVLVSGKFEQNDVLAFGSVQGVTPTKNRGLTLVARDDGRYEVWVPPGMTGHLALSGGCSACQGRCDPPGDVHAKVDGSQVSPFWSTEVETTPRSLTMTAYSAVAFTVAFDSVAFPAVELVSDAPGFLDLETTPIENGMLGGRIKNVWRDGVHRYLAYVTFRAGYGLPSPATFHWSLKVRTTGPCPSGTTSSCAGVAARVVDVTPSDHEYF